MAAQLAQAFTDFFWGAAQEIQGSINSNLPKLVERVPALGTIVPRSGDAEVLEVEAEDVKAIDMKARLAITATDDTASQQEPAKDKDD